jgi:hypothetical protein
MNYLVNRKVSQLYDTQVSDQWIDALTWNECVFEMQYLLLCVLHLLKGSFITDT